MCFYSSCQWYLQWICLCDFPFWIQYVPKLEFKPLFYFLCLVFRALNPKPAQFRWKSNSICISECVTIIQVARHRFHTNVAEWDDSQYWIHINFPVCLENQNESSCSHNRKSSWVTKLPKIIKRSIYSFHHSNRRSFYWMQIGFHRTISMDKRKVEKIQFKCD